VGQTQEKLFHQRMLAAFNISCPFRNIDFICAFNHRQLAKSAGAWLGIGIYRKHANALL